MRKPSSWRREPRAIRKLSRSPLKLTAMTGVTPGFEHATQDESGSSDGSSPARKNPASSARPATPAFL